MCDGSACAAATTRLVYTVMYYTSRDVPYTFSPFALCLLAEMTCMFLIFGGTVTPKVFTTSNVISRFFSSLTSLLWSSKGSPVKSSNPSWPGTDSTGLSNREKYPKLEANGVPHTNLFSVVRPSSVSGDQLPDAGKIESGVVLTRDFTLSEVYIERSDARSPRSPMSPVGSQAAWEISC